MKPKILLVEDNPLNMRLMEMTLGAQNYDLLKATDGQQGFDMAVKERPDLILMDMNLPVMSGFEVAKKLRELPDFRNTPIAGITALAMKGDMEKVLEAGCDVYISKPINTRELPAKIAELLAKGKNESGR
ncbi:MAG TPA: response regulator [Dehalococcoidales bacterium]|nr:response regulator [Dehalococcoidales bacterium]